MLAALIRRDVSLLRDGIERVADVERSGVAGASRTGARPAHGRARARDRHGRPLGAAGPRRDAGGVRHPAARRPRHPLARAGDPRRHAARPRARPVVGRGRDGDDDVGRGAHRPRRDDPRRAHGRAPASAPAARSHRPDPHAHRPRRPAHPHVVDEDGRRILRTLVNRSLLAAIGAVFVLASTVLLVASDQGPAVGGDTGLFEVLGYFGLLAGAVLMLRVVAAVARDGTT